MPGSAATPIPAYSPLARHWTLDPGVVFLNHGSFGACPLPVLEEQARLRAQIEREPVRFFGQTYEERLAAALAALAAFVRARQEDLVPVRNATQGVNAVLRSLDLRPGDEMLVTNHEYGACRNTLDFVARRAGARVVVAEIPFPLRSEEEALEAILEQAGPRTRLALVDHVTSQTGLVLPLARIVAGLADRGVDTLVDGAHGPGMLPLDLPALGAAFYTGNCHKWLCAPKGAAFLWVREDQQNHVRPTSISHGATAPRADRSRFYQEFSWTGTDDPTPFLCVPAALEFLRSLLPGGFPALREHNRTRVLEARRLLCAALGAPPPAPEGMIGSMASVPLPGGKSGPPRSGLCEDALQEALWQRSRIQVPVIAWPVPAQRLLRVSAQAYNAPEQYRALADALPPLLAQGL